jgi:hypothetical protein
MARRLSLLTAGAVLLLAGCAPAQPAPAQAALPDGVTASVQQSRADVGIRRLQVSVHNDSSTELRVTGLAFESGQFVEPAVWAKDETTIAAGRTVNLPVQLPGPRCHDDEPQPVAVVDFVLPDGSTGSVRLPTTDPSGRMPRLAAEDCLGLEVAGHAAITAETLPRLGRIGGVPVALLDLSVEPTGAPGSLTIDEVRGSVLLSIADPASGAQAGGLPVGLVVDGASRASAVTLTLVPNRCDPHAIAEDKRGTVFTLAVTTGDGTSGSYFVAAGDEVKQALYDFVRAACAG